ncbi:MAG: DUF1080 domain-containing protein [Akkermansiaceae bacterium]|nr:DUF1080 domain-containing protein [Akkermansiaceae bacterium]
MKGILLALVAGPLAAEPGSANPTAAPVHDFLAGAGLESFQPAGGWLRVGQVAAVPDRMELTATGRGGILVNSLTKDTAIPYLFTRESFGDVRVELEFMIPNDSNAGVYLMGRYEVQIFDSFGKQRVGSADLGGIYASLDRTRSADRQLSGGSAPLANAAKAPGVWQTMEIVFRAPRFDAAGRKSTDAMFESVVINGAAVQQNATAAGPTVSHPLDGEVVSGPIVIQGDHGPIAIRRFRATPLPSPGSAALAEINAYWAEVSRAVKEGDFAAYQATVHDQGILVAGSKQTSYPLRDALARWQADFDKTRSGAVESEVLFRFAHRYRDATTSHESGVFRYTARPQDGKATVDYIAFDALLTKQDGKWRILMEYQKQAVTQADWDALPP